MIGIGVFVEGLHFCKDQIGQIHMALFFEIVMVMGRSGASARIQHPRDHFSLPIEGILGINGNYMAGSIPIPGFFIIAWLLAEDPHLKGDRRQVPGTMIDELVQPGRGIHKSLLVIFSSMTSSRRPLPPIRLRLPLGS